MTFVVPLRTRMALTILLSLSSLLVARVTAHAAGPENMTFFLTSVGAGKGADLGGLEGADAHCAALAAAVGNTKKPWRAYLSTTAPGGDTTCGNWTKSSDEGSAIVGHHDRMGLKVSRHMMSWNSSHGTRGCSPEGLKSTGGAGLFYCFVAN